MPYFSGINHIALTVSDLHTSVAFYERVLGITSDGDMTDGAFIRRLLPLPDGSHLGLTQHDAHTSARFDPTMPGLDHVGFSCDSRDELSAWLHHLDSLGIAHGGIRDADYGSALSFKDPDGNALEFFTAR